MAIGYYELSVNGRAADDSVLYPSHTKVDKLLEIVPQDITALLQEGANALCVRLGHGKVFEKPFSIKEPSFSLTVIMRYADGQTECVHTDESWRAQDGAIVRDSVYDGEEYDARRDTEGWQLPGYQEAWLPPRVFPAPDARFAPRVAPPIRVVSREKPRAVRRLANGAYVVDAGRHLAGWLAVRVSGAAGTRVTLRYAEVCYPDGSANQESLRSAKATDVYVMSGKGEEFYEPRFTYHGFQFVQIEGYPGDLTAEDVTVCCVRNDVAETGSFECSDGVLNAVHEAMRQTFLGNFHSVPTESNARDERMGWIDAAAVEPAALNFDTHWFYRKWAEDVLTEIDGETGVMSAMIAPYRGATKLGLSSVSVYITPIRLFYNLYREFGDDDLLARAYPYLKRFYGMIENGLDETGLLIERPNADKRMQYDTSYYDWLAIDRTRGPQVQNANLIDCIRMVREMAGLMGDEDMIARLAGADDRAALEYNRRYMNEDTHISHNGYYGFTNFLSQYGQAYPILLGIEPKDLSERCREILLWDVEQARGSTQLTTGNLGTLILFKTLTAIGRDDVALKLMRREEFPGWGFMLKCGATTVWERWQRLEGAEMNAMSCVPFANADYWFYRVPGGVADAMTDENGRRRFRIAPYASPELTYVKAAVGTPWGTVRVCWTREGGQINWEIAVPPNTTASFEASGERRELSPGVHRFTLPA